MTPPYNHPQLYQPTSPSYAQPQPYQQPMLSDDDDDGEYQVLQPRSDRRAANDGDQNQNRPALEDGSGQPVQSDHAGYRPADGEDSGQVRATPRRSSQRHQRTQDSGATQSGQVAEI